MNINSFEKFSSYLYVSRETYEKFQIYYDTLIKWQKSINLISKSSSDNIYSRHFLDSAQLYKFTKKINGNILDFGSGAGFPGLVLAMMGNKNIILVESDQKKCAFMREVAMLSDTLVTIYNCRIEDLDYINADLITARALAPLDRLIEYVEMYMKKTSNYQKKFPNLLFLKGKTYKEEILKLNKTRNIDYKIYPSLTNEFSKILYIKKINMLKIKNEKNFK